MCSYTLFVLLSYLYESFWVSRIQGYGFLVVNAMIQDNKKAYVQKSTPAEKQGRKALNLRKLLSRIVRLPNITII